jgi:hypothetical protein
MAEFCELTRWAVLAMNHWKEFQPKRYRRLFRSKQLENAAHQAALATAQEVENLKAIGLTATEAFSEASRLHLFTPEEPEQRPEPMRRIVAHEAIGDFIRALQGQDEP